VAGNPNEPSNPEVGNNPIEASRQVRGDRPDGGHRVHLAHRPASRGAGTATAAPISKRSSGNSR